MRAGDGFACGGDEFSVCEVLVGAVGFGSCGVEGCGGDEVLEVVYWVCVVMLPIGLSHLGVSKSYHSGDRDTRWVFCYSRGCGCGDVKMADFSSPCLQGEPAGGGRHLPFFVNFVAAIGITPLAQQGSPIPPSVRFPPLREGNRTVRPLGSPCEQGEP